MQRYKEYKVWLKEKFPFLHFLRIIVKDIVLNLIKKRHPKSKYVKLATKNDITEDNFGFLISNQPQMHMGKGDKTFHKIVNKHATLCIMCFMHATHFKTCRTPIHKLDCLVQLGCCDCRVDVLWHDVSAIEQTDGHVLPLLRIALDHLTGGLKARLGDHVHAQLFVCCLKKNRFKLLFRRKKCIQQRVTPVATN